MACIWDKRNTYMFLVEKRDRNRPFGKPALRYVVNIKMHLKSNWKRAFGLDVAGQRLAETCERSNKLFGFTKCGKFQD